MVHLYRSMGHDIVMDVCSGAVHVVDDLVYDVISLYDFYLNGGASRTADPEGRVQAGGIADHAVSGQAGGDTDRAAGGQAEDIPDLIARALTAGDVPASVRQKLPEGFKGGPWDEADVREGLEDVAELIEKGELFAPDEYEECLDAFRERGPVVKALCLHISHDCNLACRYCFAGEGEYHGRREFMSFETGRKALDFLMDASGSRRNLEVDFFGGEPLMNWQTIKDLVAYGRSKEEERGKRFRFTVTTNGMLLNDDVTDFCNAEMGNVVLSLDGRRAVHDYMRPTRGGKGSYDVVVPKFQRFAERREGQYYLRGTFTRHNLDFAKDVEHYLDLGFDELSMEPVVAPDEEDYAIRQEDLPRVMEEYDRLAELYVQRAREGSPFTFFHFMIDLKQGPCAAKRLSGCGSGCEYLSVTPDGRLWPCHQFAGEDEFLLGNVDEGITNRELTEKFSRRSVYTNEKCRGCFARFYCSGGCAANAFHYDGSLWGAYDTGCEMERKRVECAIAIQAELAEDE